MEAEGQSKWGISGGHGRYTVVNDVSLTWDTTTTRTYVVVLTEDGTLVGAHGGMRVGKVALRAFVTTVTSFYVNRVTLPQSSSFSGMPAKTESIEAYTPMSCVTFSIGVSTAEMIPLDTEQLANSIGLYFGLQSNSKRSRCI